MEHIEEKDLLLAEDDKEDVEIFRWAMDETKIPYLLRHAEDGNALFVHLEEKIPYILFLDIDMPCKDGISCIMEIRRNRRYDKLPVIMYSAMLQPHYVEGSYRNGANMFLAKADRLDRMVNSLKKVFGIDWDRYLHFPTRDDFMIQGEA